MAFGKHEGKNMFYRNLMRTDCLNMKTGPKMFWMNSPRILRMLLSPLGPTVGADETFKSKVLDH